ncbi:MAG TPA: hypothetical protein VLY83_06725 [Methanoregula sp.]|nr:hypothetical protein [Methanoregula sp.]
MDKHWIVFFLLVPLGASAIMVPASAAAVPLWQVKAASGVTLSTVAIPDDGSLVLAGGGQLMALTPSGEKLWSAWSGNTVALSRDGSYIAASQGTNLRLFSRDGTRLWDQYLGTMVSDVSITPDATIIAAGGGNTIQVWYNSGVGLGINSTGIVRHVRISPSKDQLIVTTDSALRSFNISCVPLWVNTTISPDLVEISGDGTGFVIPYGNHLRLYHGSGTLLWDRTIPGGNVAAVAYSRDGSTIVLGRDDGSVIVVDANNNILWTKSVGYWPASVAVSDNGSVIAAGCLDKTIRLFDRKGDDLGSYTVSNQIGSNSVAVSGDGSLVAATDGSYVYGFAPSPGTQETISGTAAPSATPAPPVETTVTALPTASSPQFTSVPATSTPASAGFPWLLAGSGLVSAAVLRRRQS